MLEMIYSGLLINKFNVETWSQDIDIDTLLNRQLQIGSGSDKIPWYSLIFLNFTIISLIFPDALSYSLIFPDYPDFPDPLATLKYCFAFIQ